jgi:two-component sensor histidine kinase
MAFEYEWKGHDIDVDGDVGIDLGMMVNEIVTNSVKHAYAGRGGGRVFLSAVARGPRKLSLAVGDEGEGGGTGEEGKGRKIIAALAKHLGASMSLDRSRGWVYRFELELPEPGSDEIPLEE